jgi:hypothetical protein
MRIFLNLLVVIMAAFAYADSQAEKDWAAWIQDQNKQLSTNPKSYLNVNDAAYLKKDQTVYIPLGLKDLSSYKWSEKPIKDFAVKIHFNGKEAIIERPDIKPYDLLKDHEVSLNPDILIQAYLLDDGMLRLFIHNLQHPKVKNFKGLKFYPYNPAMVITGTFKRMEPFEEVTFATERHLTNKKFKLGRIDFKVGNEDNSLNLYGDLKNKYFFVWFKDKTSGHGSYGAARELEFELKDVPADGEKIVLDFNRLTNPNCARSTFYNCLVARDPALKSAIPAGEMDPGEHH